MTRGFEKKILHKLLALIVREPVLFVPFAEELTQDSRLRWHAPGSTQPHDLFKMSIERTVIRMLADFGVPLPKYHEKPSHFDELVNFQITVFGKGLLEVIRKS